MNIDKELDEIYSQIESGIGDQIVTRDYIKSNYPFIDLASFDEYINTNLTDNSLNVELLVNLMDALKSYVLSLGYTFVSS